jgi:predicted NBD/HSP70 family sugar kinase/biotin operon repressor
LSRPRRNNRLRILDALRHEGAASRPDLVRLTGLSRTTVTGIVDVLQDQGLVVEQEANGTGRAVGRPAMLLRLNARAGAAVGIAVGPHTARVAIADLSASVLAEHQVDVESPLDGLDQAASLVEAALSESGVPRDRIIGAAVALPGPIHARTGAPRTPSLLRLAPNQQNPQDTLQRLLDMPVTVDNDANLEAVAEHAYGAGRGVDNLVYVTIGEGIGAGMILSGSLQHGASGLAGEIGHIQVEPNGGLCRCGSRGCLGTVAATGPLLDALRITHGPDLDIDDLLALLAANDPGVRRIINDAGDAIGRVLADIASIVNPSRIVIGGTLARCGDALTASMSSVIARRAQPSAAEDVTVIRGELGDRAGVLGAVHTVIHDPRSRSRQIVHGFDDGG